MVTCACNCRKPILERLKQEGSNKFETSLGYMVAPCHKTATKLETMKLQRALTKMKN